MLEPPHARRIHGAAESLPVLSGLRVFLSLNVRVYRTTTKPTDALATLTTQHDQSRQSTGADAPRRVSRPEAGTTADMAEAQRRPGPFSWDVAWPVTTVGLFYRGKYSSLGLFPQPLP